jgi:hypothetical protein
VWWEVEELASMSGIPCENKSCITPGNGDAIIQTVLDLILYVLLGLFVILQSVWGGILSVKSLPANEKKLPHFRVIILFGVAALALTVATGIRNFIVQHDAAIQQQALLAQVKQTRETMIGSADSYCVVYPAMIAQDDGTTRFTGTVAFIKRGPTPLYGVRVGIWVHGTGLEGGRAPDYLLGDSPAEGHNGCGLATMITLTAAPGSNWTPIASNNVDIHAEFTARNGDWMEETYLRPVGKNERTAIIVYRNDSNGRPQELFRSIENDFPMATVKWPY